jgi:hypothetical protein
MRAVLAAVALLAISSAVTAQQTFRRSLKGEKDHKYKEGEAVPLWASKIGPFTNPR